MLLLAASTPMQAQIVNGGFETGDIDGWTQTGDARFSGVGSGPDAFSGTYFYFSGPVGGVGTLGQTIATTIGARYTFAFWLSNQSGGSPNSFDASFGGASVFGLSNSPDFGYTYHQFAVTALSATTNVVFTFRSDPGFWFLDEVSVTDMTMMTIPEPSSVALSLVGLLGLGAAVCARRRSDALRA